VNDPFTFGRIAAINSISDVYAMGADPLAALNVVGFPGGLEPEILGEMLHGGQEAAADAGVPILGGHTFQDSEIRYGLAVTGEIHPDKIITNSDAKPGDKLILTKPLGTGTVIQAMVTRGVVSESLYRAAIDSMTTPNLEASRAMRGIANACTDITGFGFLGHCWEIAEASGAGVVLTASCIPVMPKVLDLIRDGVIDAGTKQNRNSFEKYAIFNSDVPSEYGTLLYSSETSGGLLIAVPEDKVAVLQQDLRQRGVSDVIVGEVTSENTGVVGVKN